MQSVEVFAPAGRRRRNVQVLSGGEAERDCMTSRTSGEINKAKLE